MNESNAEIVSSFIDGAPPGELADVVADIRALVIDDPNPIESLGPAFEKYNHEQLMTVKLPGESSIREVIVSSYNFLKDGRRYYDVESQTSFDFDHVTQKASGLQSYVLQSQCVDLVSSLLKHLSTYAQEHYSNASYGVYPVENDSLIAILLVANKYSPNNFWNGRWRSQYFYSPTDPSLTGKIQVDVHYYENGNVRLLTNKAIDKTTVYSSSTSTSAHEIIRQIASIERKYQEELNRAFVNLSEGAFKGLRRPLPITRQKIEWEKISSYRVGRDVSVGGRSR